jgi:hypothetical protein
LSALPKGVSTESSATEPTTSRDMETSGELWVMGCG